MCQMPPGSSASVMRLHCIEMCCLGFIVESNLRETSRVPKPYRPDESIATGLIAF